MMQLSIGNAAGTCKTLEDVRAMVAAVDEVLTVGTIVVPEREGHDGLPFYRHDDWSYGGVNKLGIPCRGFAYYDEMLSAMSATAAENGKALAVSIAALSQGELGRLAHLCECSLVPVIEVNEGCPNIIGADGKQKPIPSYDPESIDRDLCEVKANIQGGIVSEVRVKLSPYFDSILIDEVADVLKKHADVVPVFCNTLPNVYMMMANRLSTPAILLDHLGGHSGSDVFRWIVCGVIAQFRQRLGNERRMIGVGGIYKGEHLCDYTSFGINEMQVGMHLYGTGDPRVLNQLRLEYAATIA